MKEKTRQVIYFQTPNVLSLSEKLDSTRIINIGKTTYDSEDELKRMYPINADKLETTAWNLFDNFEIKETFEKLANEFYKTKKLDMDQPFHNYIKANSTDWVWVDPYEYSEIKGSLEIFRYIGPKPMKTAIAELIQQLKKYQVNVISKKDVFYSNIYDDSKKTICSREMITKIAKLTDLFFKKEIIPNDSYYIDSENEKTNLIHVKSVWYKALIEDKRYIHICVDIINGNVYLYIRQPSNKVCNALISKFQSL
ncbi:MAG: hypothetical protein J6X11_04320 [Treponema sp.]|nr:hypothetical protein [Treponema sp.]